MPKSPSRKTADLEIAVTDASRSSGLGVSATQKSKAQAGRIMYIEDEDVREEYWRDIRRQPERIHEPVA